ncbi:hypothetical protein EDB89DRAFT_2081693 [Lactarius sanguifluus]|nr:hypothetical protein EDB89DRAFT_2081693 [Lactarius sanguifluus]
MTGYSSIFSSGLLATPRPPRHADPSDYSMSSQTDCSINIDYDPETTPTKLNTPLDPSFEDVMDYFMPRSRTSSNASTNSSAPGGVPRLRRRRSSLSVANNGLGAIKSPQRNVGFALQRSTLISPGGRARSGSVDVGPAGVPRHDELCCVPVPGRIGSRSRSGSIGGALRSRRALRKPPPVPPPNVPLPPLPPLASTAELSPRHLLVHRTQTTENFDSFAGALGPDATSPSFLMPVPDFTNNLKAIAGMGAIPLSSGPLAEVSAFWGPGARTNGN